MDIMDAIKRMLRLLGAVLTIAFLLAVVVWLTSLKTSDAAEIVIKQPSTEIVAPNTPSKIIPKFDKNKKNQHKNGKKKFLKPSTKNIS